MSNLAGMPPRGLKQERAAPDPAYLAAVRELQCCVCIAFGATQVGPTYAHHVHHGRFSQRKTPDRMAIPLCWSHHQGPYGVHADKQGFAARWGEDHTYSAATQNAVERMRT